MRRAQNDIVIIVAMGQKKKGMRNVAFIAGMLESRRYTLVSESSDLDCGAREGRKDLGTYSGRNGLCSSITYRFMEFIFHHSSLTTVLTCSSFTIFN